MPPDVQQQRDIGKAFGAIAKLEGDVREIRTALIGIDGTNGLRGELRTWVESMSTRLDQQDSMLTRRVEWETSLEAQFSLYLNKTRGETCIGKKALEEYEEELAKKLEERKQERRAADTTMVSLEKLRLTMEASSKRSRNAMFGMIIVALISTGGLVVNKWMDTKDAGTIQQSK
jgi:hypothetical protein